MTEVLGSLLPKRVMDGVPGSWETDTMTEWALARDNSLGLLSLGLCP